MKTDFNHVIFLDEIDRKIIYVTQSGLPLVSRPYQNIAHQLGISSEEVIKRMKIMQRRGVIRRIAAVPNHYALGYKANAMTVWDIPDYLVNTFGQRIGALDFVSHCYRRPRYLPDWPYNLFAMVHAFTREEAMLLVNRIAEILGNNNRGSDVLFSQRILKKTGMRLISKSCGGKNVSN